jgi:NAD(P)-dependent dehydrogenase (short-subunit alcohol dehydrogenase family)
MEGKIALVTGGGSGIGRATAIVFARDGAKVVVADVTVEGGEETVRRIRDAKGEAIFVKTDVSQAVEVAALINAAVETYGRLDCAFNNAGIAGTLATVADCTEENWERVINTNLKGVWLCMKYEIRQMLEHGGGAIVNTSSVYGLVGARRGLPAYVASKHGIVGLTKAAALEYAQAGIRVNAVSPGGVYTPMQEGFIQGNSQVKAQIDASHPIGRMGTPAEIAEAVVWLCSDAASFVTGHTLVADGGLIAG